MKIKIVLLVVCLLAFGSISFAQKKKPTATAVAPEQVVKNLYAVKDAANPFFQKKSRALVDKYFTKDLADLIWKTNKSDTAWNVDPLYNSQDPQITGFVVGKPKEDGGAGNVFVKATFKSYGKAESVGFKLIRSYHRTGADVFDLPGDIKLFTLLR